MIAPVTRPRRHRLLVAVVVAAVLLPAAWFTFQWATEPDAPSAFYRPPDSLPAGPPGTIIREEPVRSAPADEQVRKVLYTSTNAAGEAIAVSGVVFAPDRPPPKGGWSVVAWAHGTTGVSSRCAPSLWSDAGRSKIPELGRLLAAGNVVVVTDYPGLGTPGPHPYLVGESEGRAVIDSIRAARTLLPGQTNATSVVFGHSQGGHAVVFAAALARSYAPELHVVGAAAMAPPTDLGRLLLLDAKEPAGIVLTALAVQSWSELYKDVSEATIVGREARPIVARLAGRCVDTTMQGISDAPDILALKVRFLSTDPATAPGWKERLRVNSPARRAIRVPLLVAQGLTDTLVRPPVTEAFVREQCAAGASIRLHTYAGVGHFQVRTVAAPDVVEWLLARLDGAPIRAGCTSEKSG